MNRRQSGFLSLTMMAGLVTTMGAGCGDTTTPGGTTPTAPQTFDYVINTLAIDGNTDPNMAHTGFNVDGRFSGSNMGSLQPADCTHVDYFSTIDSDQNEGTCPGAMCKGGVDNQLPALSELLGSLGGVNVNASIMEQLTTGKLVLLLRVSNVNGAPGPSLNDSDVTVRIFIGRPMVSDCAQLFSANGRFAVDTASLRAGSMNLDDAQFQFPGSIVNGRLRITPSMGMGGTLPIPLPEIMGLRLTLNVRNPQIRMTLTADRGTNGNLGGFLRSGDILDLICMTPQTMQFCSAAPGFISGLVDVQNMMSCDAPNGGIGLGLGLTAVKTTIQAAPVTGAQMGMCGSR